jgi:hypothetical protein
MTPLAQRFCRTLPHTTPGEQQMISGLFATLLPGDAFTTPRRPADHFS